MANINEVVLSGNLAKDPEIREVKNGIMAVFNIAVNTGYGDHERVDFPQMRYFGKKAEFIKDYVRKGDTINITGKIQTDRWEEDGIAHYSTYILGREIEKVQSKRKSENSEKSEKEENSEK